MCTESVFFPVAHKSKTWLIKMINKTEKWTQNKFSLRSEILLTNFLVSAFDGRRICTKREFASDWYAAAENNITFGMAMAMVIPIAFHLSIWAHWAMGNRYIMHGRLAEYSRFDHRSNKLQRIYMITRYPGDISHLHLCAVETSNVQIASKVYQPWTGLHFPWKLD